MVKLNSKGLRPPQNFVSKPFTAFWSGGHNRWQKILKIGNCGISFAYFSKFYNKPGENFDKSPEARHQIGKFLINSRLKTLNCLNQLLPLRDLVWQRKISRFSGMISS